MTEHQPDQVIDVVRDEDGSVRQPVAFQLLTPCLLGSVARALTRSVYTVERLADTGNPVVRTVFCILGISSNQFVEDSSADGNGQLLDRLRQLLLNVLRDSHRALALAGPRRAGRGFGEPRGSLVGAGRG